MENKVVCDLTLEADLCWGNSPQNSPQLGDLAAGTELPKLHQHPAGPGSWEEECGKDAVENAAGGRCRRGVGLFVRAKKALLGGCY